MEWTRVYLFAANSMGLYSFACTQRAPGKASVRYCVTVVQGHRNCYQWKARMRLPISLPM